MIVVIADSITTSLMPAGSVCPIGDVGSISMSRYKPLWRNRTEAGEAASPV
ncbi:Uncharacterised protein [Mycobacteroides abscessus subsp. abscessus]|nr:Uncharacterised protein [Mycobacteroides abscessus subsp. abscessus]